jgi:predicted metal-dependent HD superfamily phosphohydrolase
MMHGILLLKNTLTAVQEFVPGFLEDNLSASLVFHNVDHTVDVVRASKEIGIQSKLTPEQFNVVQIAAWFHDCGYTDIYTGHETLSKQIARDFLISKSYPDELIEIVSGCIEATRYPQEPKTLEAKVVCDADLYHFTKPDYHNYEESLRNELAVYFKKEYTDEEWAKTNCEMMITHCYFTEYGKTVLQKFKEINIENMKCRFKE